MPCGTESQHELFDKVCAELQMGGKHRQGQDSPCQTLNRLFRKHLSLHKKDIAKDPPWLSSENVGVELETWSVQHLKKIVPEQTTKTPHRTDLPVVVVRYRGQECLIDGRRRINSWDRSGASRDEQVWVLTVIG